jgi:hypothetical protein
MTLYIDRADNFYTPEEAVRIAAKLQSGDALYTYRATNPKGKLGPKSKIEVRDEDGHFAGFF